MANYGSQARPSLHGQSARPIPSNEYSQTRMPGQSIAPAALGQWGHLGRARNIFNDRLLIVSFFRLPLHYVL